MSKMSVIKLGGGLLNWLRNTGNLKRGLHPVLKRGWNLKRAKMLPEEQGVNTKEVMI